MNYNQPMDALDFHKHIRQLLQEKLEEKLPDSIESPLLSTLTEEEITSPAEIDALDQIKETAASYGGVDIHYEEGLFAVTIPSKINAEHFATFLDSHDAVDTYEIHVVSDDPVTDDTSDDEESEIDFDDIEDDEDNAYEFEVYLNPDIVSFNSEEIEVDPNEVINQENGKLFEVKRIIKINFRGKRRIKMQCNPGFKWDSKARVCRKITGSELAKKRIALRHAVRTKRAKGAGYRRKILRKTRKAMRFRKSFGLGR